MTTATTTNKNVGNRTAISWTDLTANFWMGCSKVSEGCRNCYAENLVRGRFKIDVWGKNANRQPVKSVQDKLRSLARSKEPGVLGDGKPKLVFVGSLMDWAEDRADLDPLRAAMWETIRNYPQMRFQLLTKRPENIRNCLPADWGNGYSNVWLGTSIENMAVADRADALRDIPATVRFISCEPALGPLDELDLTGISWVIYGGESGSGRRPEGTREDPKKWARSMRDRCRQEHVAFFHKQSTAFKSGMGVELDGEVIQQFPISSRR